MNVNIADDERNKQNVENKKKRPDYNPYDDASIDEYGMVGHKCFFFFFFFFFSFFKLTGYFLNWKYIYFYYK